MSKVDFSKLIMLIGESIKAKGRGNVSLTHRLSFTTVYFVIQVAFYLALK